MRRGRDVRPTVSAGLPALGDDRVHASRFERPGFRDIRGRAQQHDAGVLHGVDEPLFWVTEVEADDFRLERQDDLESPFIKSEVDLRDVGRRVPQIEVVVPRFQPVARAGEHRRIGAFRRDDEEIEIEGSVGPRADGFRVLSDRFRRLFPAAQRSEPAGIGDRARHRRRATTHHRRLYYRVIDPQKVAKPMVGPHS